MSGRQDEALCPNEHKVHDLDGEGVRVTCGDTVLAEERWGKVPRRDMSDTIRVIVSRAYNEHSENLLRAARAAAEARADKYAEALREIDTLLTIGMFAEVEQARARARAALSEPAGEGDA